MDPLKVEVLPNVEVARFGTPQTLRFAGLDPPNVEVSRFGLPKR